MQNLSVLSSMANLSKLPGALAWFILSCCFMSISIPYFCGTFIGFNNEIGISGIPKEIVTFGENVQAVFSTYRISSSYGLFRVMTGVDGRYELVVYGSNDRKHWEVYEFAHKPVKTSKMPSFVAPHQPRLDWQLWFSALNPGISQNDSYFGRFIHQLFYHSKSVKTLLGKDPFEDSPPQYLKVNRIMYEFTKFEDLKDGDMSRMLMAMLAQTVHTNFPSISEKLEISEIGKDIKWWKAGKTRKKYLSTVQRSDFKFAADDFSEYPLHPMQAIDLRYLLCLLILRIWMNLRKK